MNSVYDVLEQRGFISQCTDENLREMLAKEKFTVYAGFDPTADSLHLGHIVPVMGLRHFQQAGHRILLVVGGATGMVGDPSGRSEERKLLTIEKVQQNIECVRDQFARYLDLEGENPAVILNNYDWISKMSFIDWLRDVGKYFTINYMLAKDSVSRRIDSEQGISFTEFSYMTMQAYDFLHLFNTYDCRLEVGGNDQWGNITAGTDLIRKMHQQQAYGITFPLIMSSSGEKYGKSAGNAIWLDPKRTSPWDFYQYFVRQEDVDVIRFLKVYTFVPVEEIRELEQATANAPEARAAQKRLAYEVTQLVHGEAIAKEMVRAAEVVYHSEIKDLSDATLAAVFASVHPVEVKRTALSEGIDFIEFLASSGICQSKGDARRRMQAGGVYVNNVRADGLATMDTKHLASPSFIVVRLGKKDYHLVRVV